MSSPKWVKDLEDEAGNRPVLLVEGNIDERVLAYFLTQLSPGWETQFVILPAKNKGRVIEAVRDYRPDWAGIVDRDEWSPDQLEERIETLPRVKILPRFCLENYFCIPAELWSALPQAQQATIADDPQRLATPILAALADWVAHGAMWRVIHKKRQRLLYEHSFPARLDRGPITNRTEIRHILESWYAQLDPDRILEDYDRELAVAQNLSAEEQLKTYIHGKKFFRRVVVQTLNRLLPRHQQSPDKWQENFTRTPTIGLLIPPDLTDFLAEILALLKEGNHH